MFHFFIRVHAATLFSICLVGESLDIEANNKSQSESNETNLSGEILTMPLNNTLNNGPIDDFSQFVRRRLKTEAVKQKLGEFAMKKQAYIPLIDANVNRGLSLIKRIETENLKYEDSSDTASKILEIVGIGPNEINYEDETEEAATERFIPIETIAVPAQYPVTKNDVIDEASMEYENDEYKVLKKNMKTDAFMRQFSTTKTLSPQKNPNDSNNSEINGEIKTENFEIDNESTKIKTDGNFDSADFSVAVKENLFLNNVHSNEIESDKSNAELPNLKYNLFEKTDITDKLSIAKLNIPNYTKNRTTESETTNAYESLRREIFQPQTQNKVTTAKTKRLIRKTIKPTARRDESNKDVEDKQKIIKILNRENEIIYILRKQTELLEQVARILDKDPTRSRNDFQDLLSELEKKKKALEKGKNMTQAAVDVVKKKLKMLQLKDAAQVAEVTAAEVTKKRMLSTVKTIIDETEIRDALKKDPYVQRIIKMAKSKRNQYVKDAMKLFGS